MVQDLYPLVKKIRPHKLNNFNLISIIIYYDVAKFLIYLECYFYALF